MGSSIFVEILIGRHFQYKREKRRQKEMDFSSFFEYGAYFRAGSFRSFDFNYDTY